MAKTTTSVNLSAALAREGHRVLLIDLDPQANATQSLALPDGDMAALGIAEVLEGKSGMAEAARYLSPTLQLVPSHIKLARLEPLIQGALDTYRLRDALSPIATDFVILDCPPSLGALTTNALVAATDVIVPVTASYYGLSAVSDFMETMQVVKRRINADLRVLGILVTIYDARPTISKDVVALLVKTYRDVMFTTMINKNIRLDEAASAQQSIFDYDPSSRGAEDYQALLQEVLSRVQA
ncbi:MAG: ParA family protein [Deinococcota bacterium]|nr:ParA family protein [Deinococcota bacterium]